MTTPPAELTTPPGGSWPAYRPDHPLWCHSGLHALWWEGAKSLRRGEVLDVRIRGERTSLRGVLDMTRYQREWLLEIVGIVFVAACSAGTVYGVSHGNAWQLLIFPAFFVGIITVMALILLLLKFVEGHDNRA